MESGQVITVRDLLLESDLSESPRVTAGELIKELHQKDVRLDLSVLVRTEREKEGFYTINYVNHVDDSIILEVKSDAERGKQLNRKVKII